MNNDYNQMWHLIALEDPPEYLNAITTTKLLKLLEDHFNYKYIILHEFEGAGKPGVFQETRKKIESFTVFTFAEVYEILKDVQQFDWVDFFLFFDFPKDWEYAEDFSYHPLLSQSDGLVRGVDNRYLYIYTPNQSVIDSIQKKYPPCAIIEKETNELQNLIVPY